MKIFKNSIIYSIIVFVSFFLIQFIGEYYSYLFFAKNSIATNLLDYISWLTGFIILGIALYLYIVKSELQIDRSTLKPKILYLVILIAICSIFGFRFVFKIINSFESLTNPASISSLNFGWKYVFYFISSIIFAPIIEEIVFRGIILKRLISDTEINTFFAVLFTSFLFSLTHSTITGVLISLALGLVFCLVYINTRNIYYCIVLHAIYNLMRFLIITNSSIGSFFEDNFNYETPILLFLILISLTVIIVSLKLIKKTNQKN